MDLRKLVTLDFDENVGTVDRVFRFVSATALLAAAWSFALPLAVAIGVSVLGLMWLATGVLSKCSIYYALGYSSCSASRRQAVAERTREPAKR
jgi:hypothetical protein